MKKMIVLLFLALLVLEYISEWFLVKWSKNDINWMLAVGVAGYILSTIAWAMLMKTMQIMVLSTLYSTVGLLSWFVLGVFVAKETVTMKKVLAAVLATIAAILIGI
jgi:multidrug transporter EmrE-like cation transporter